MNVFKRKIVSINFLPVGGLIKVDAPISSDIFEDLLIAVGGIGMQVIFGLLIQFLYKLNIIEYNIYNLFRVYNILIISFNLIPISPLDGSKIVNLLIELIIPYKKVFTASLIISLLMLIFILISRFNIIRDNTLVFIFLTYMILEKYKNRKYFINRFYLERALNNFYFKKVNYIKNESYMYKNRLHFIKGIDERSYLIRKFFKNKEYI